ncbi:MAG TPA: hypothetical protein VF834_18825 [Streptosporangiaceae bacterium]
MAWTRVKWYSLGFNIVSKQCYFYYGLEGESVAHEVFVTAAQMSALGDMFRNEGPITYNSEGHYFVSNEKRLMDSKVISAPPDLES